MTNALCSLEANVSFMTYFSSTFPRPYNLRRCGTNLEGGARCLGSAVAGGVIY